MAGRRGGRRPRAGRPATKPKPPVVVELPERVWREVREAAAAGTPERTIIKALGIPELLLEDAVALLRFREEVGKGHALYELELRKTIRKRGLKSTKAAGSVNALALQARNILDWDKQIPTQEVEPDLGTSRQRLRDLFVKLAAARSEIEGRKVTPLELLHREAHADQAESGKEA